MFASTTQVRSVFNKAFTACNVQCPKHTWTDKTTENDPKRRSVVFPVWGDSSAKNVAETAAKLLKETGYTKSKVKLTQSDYSSCSYIRVIAYVD